MTEHYDVIVIGSGAGGGTLARQLAPSGKRHPAAGARRLAPARAGRTGWRTRSSSTTATSRRTPGTTATESRSSRRSTTSSAAPPSSTARRSTACARRTSASCATTTASRPRGRSPTTSSSRTTHARSSSTSVHGARGEDPTEAPASAPYPYPAVSHEPRIQQLSDDLAAEGLPPVPRALRGDARRGRPAVQRLRALPELRRLPVRGAREVRRRGARRATGARARERHAADGRPRDCAATPTPPAPS